jgi:ABC-type molybdate transport system substrate-binding protein
MKGAAHEFVARGFIDLVLSAQGQEVLQKYGFKPVASK